MKREFYLDLAKQGIKMPIGADLTLKSKANHEALLLDGAGLGDVIVETARRFKTPLAFPLMDLTVEKEWLMRILGVPAEEISTRHFESRPSAAEMEKVMGALESAKSPQTPRMKANCDALRHVASHDGSLVPVGMAIGPFSMMTKLLKDPITGVFLAGEGMGGADYDEVSMVEAALELSLAVIMKSIRMQAEAGAKAICLCEPAANLVYISPRQIEGGSEVFEKLVLAPNLKIRKLMDELDVDLIFHDCGELVDPMVSSFKRLDPAILSLGSSRVLWDDAHLVSKSTVMFGNLPTKKFYSDADMPKEKVAEMSKRLLTKMQETGHPFILGSECDVLSVPEYAGTILEKVEAMLAV